MKLKELEMEHLEQELETGIAATALTVKIKEIQEKKTIQTKKGMNLIVTNMMVEQDDEIYRLGLFGSKADLPIKLDLNEGETILIHRAFFKIRTSNGLKYKELTISDYFDKTFNKEYIEKVK